jgi:hypothetical protein
MSGPVPLLRASRRGRSSAVSFDALVKVMRPDRFCVRDDVFFLRSRRSSLLAVSIDAAGHSK